MRPDKTKRVEKTNRVDTLSVGGLGREFRLRAGQLRLLLLSYIVVMTLLQLWPYDFECWTCQNGASWTQAGEGMDFGRSGLLRSVDAPGRLRDHIVENQAFSLEGWISTATLDQGGPARIVSYSSDPWHRNFTVSQDQATLVVRVRTTRSSSNGTPEIRFADVFVPQRLQQLVVTVDSDNVCTYLDGALKECVPAAGGSFSNWDRDFPLLIGNEATGNRPWLGSVAKVAIFDHALTPAQVAARYASGLSAAETGGPVALFTFGEGDGRMVHDTSGTQPPVNLDLPGTYVRPHVILTTHARQAEDFLFNFLLYFPLGFLLYAGFVGENPFDLRLVFGVLLCAVLLGGFLEFLQHYIMSRTSSLLDLANGTLGAIGGVIAAGVTIRAHGNARSAEKNPDQS